MKSNILAVIIFLLLLTGIGFGSGEIQALYNRTTGVHVSSSETDMFHASKGFTDGMAQDLSRYKLEYTQSTDVVGKKAIIDHINEEFANFDEGVIKNSDLRNFLMDCRNGNLK